MDVGLVPDCFLGHVPPKTGSHPCLPELHCPRIQSSQKTPDSGDEAEEGGPKGKIGGWGPKTGTNPALFGQPEMNDGVDDTTDKVKVKVKVIIVVMLPGG